ncbi:MAG: 3-deoxy-8-phosphooctulonate synthase [Planctomycetaceae bacterium]|jgi:2-dehydro-3-deoxyphosphooctonate aldolase (KDO 8-P synthase)|nr:3-deoxy-8-phosphooctulonate synthase [Planctomycetaceae bacterium]
MHYPAKIAQYKCGSGAPLLVIAGPCTLQPEYNSRIADTLAKLNDLMPVNIVFKGSFDKANRTSVDSPRGTGLDAGLKMLAEIKQRTGLPVTTDIHESYQAEAVGQVCDLIQIPAFLARQTDLLTAAAKTGQSVNVKKGQFMSPKDMLNVIKKLSSAGCHDVILCERGTFFGYGRLVNDMQSLVIMREFGVPVCFDATHSVQDPGGLGTATGGNRRMIEPLARAAVAVGIDAIFLETHPEPEKSPSDGYNMLPLDQLETFLTKMLLIREAAQSDCLRI